MNELQPVTIIDQLMLSCIEQSEAHDREYQHGINEVKDTTSLVTKTPWLWHTKWEERFMGCDMKVLHDMMNPPETRDYAARRMWDASLDILADKSIQMDPNFDFMGFLMKNNRAVRHPLIVQAIEAIKSLPGISSIGAVGILTHSI